jgi:nanoRNase/pAp phosphatase (c-di-AMP/oligoRNAs hydrolase)
MAFTNEQQAVKLIEGAKQILIITREHPTLDSISSAVAIGLVLKKLSKSFDVVVPGIEEKNYPGFLPKLAISSEPGAMRAFHVKLDVSKAPLSELMYDVKDGELTMTLVPKHGEWEAKDVRIDHGSDRYDLIIAVDAPDMKSLGNHSAGHADFLYRTNIINIDHSVMNEHWGQMNLIDLNAVSTTETIYHFLNAWNASSVTPDVATCLLAGMIAKTKSFRTKNVTPNTLRASSELLEKGARREEIVKQMWRVQNVSGLKLWGRVLSRLEHDIDSGLVWSSLTEQDLIETGARVESLETLVDDVLAYAPEAKVVVFFTPHQEGVCVTLHTVAPKNAAELARPFGASGTQERAVFIYKEESSTTERIKAVLERLRLTIHNNRA